MKADKQHDDEDQFAAHLEKYHEALVAGTATKAASDTDP